MKDNEYRERKLPQGTLRYLDSGSGPVIVFLHGFLVNARHWRKVTPLLTGHFRCVVPELPLGAHRVNLNPGADLSPNGVATLIAAFIEALDLKEVTLIGNDSGGALAQLVITHFPQRITRLILTNCDAYQHFPPLIISPLTVGSR